MLSVFFMLPQVCGSFYVRNLINDNTETVALVARMLKKKNHTKIMIYTRRYGYEQYRVSRLIKRSQHVFLLR
jgi:hypothetical protein